MACSSSKDDAPAVGLEVVKTELPSGYLGGTGKITLSEGGFEVRTDADWLTATLASGSTTELVVTVSQNPSEESRTANIILTKGDIEQRIPFTQLGVVNNLRVEDVTIDSFGATLELDASGLATAPTVSLSDDSWVSYRLEDGKLIFEVEEAALTSSLPRRSIVKIKTGLMEHSFVITQEYSRIANNQMLGAYILAYTDKNGTRRTKTVNLIPYLDANGQQYPDSLLLSGLGADVPLGVEADGDITLKTMVKTTPRFMLGLSYFASGVTFDPITDLVYRGVWDKTFVTPKYTFPSVGVAGSEPNGFRFIYFSAVGVRHVKDYIGITLTKQA